MNFKTLFTTGLFISMAATSAVTYAEEEVQTQSRTMKMMQQGSTYAENEGRNFSQTEMNRAPEQNQKQNKNQYRYGADNDSGNGTKTRTRTRSRDGSGSGSQTRSGGSMSGSRGGGGRH